MKRVKYIFCLLLLPIFSIAEGYSIFEDNGKVRFEERKRQSFNSRKV
jgi:hypothetical protein